MDKITKLQIFDFDETFFRMPSYSSIPHADTEKFKDAYSFYDSSESLSDINYNIKVIEPVYEAWSSGKNDMSTVQALITHRVTEVASDVMKILNIRRISFDYYFFLGRVSPKSDEIFNMLRANPSIDTIEIYEDSINEIFKYQSFFNKNKHNMDIRYYIVDKSSMFRISDVELTEAKRIKLI